MVKKIAIMLALAGAIVAGVLFFYNRTIETIEDVLAFENDKNTAVFAAYSTDGTVSQYVVSYLKKLKEIAPNIVYITDNPIKYRELLKIRPYVVHIEAKRHGEYDWGSYKRGYNWLKQKGYINHADKLIFANDSALPVASSFEPIIDKMPDEADFFGITANIDGTYHLQSYFLVFRSKVYQHPEFAAYLNRVQKEKDGLAVAYRYEVPFTLYLENLGFKSDVYIPYQNLSALPLNDKNCYPLTMLSKYHAPFLKMRTFTNRLDVQESRRLVFEWLKKNAPSSYQDLILHLDHIKSPYLKDNR